MDSRLQELINQVDHLIEALVAEEERRAAAMGRVAENHRRGAVNLVHYAELRGHDIRKMQNELSASGATSLTTT